MPATTKEVGHFRAAFAELVATYGDLFHLLTCDAGGRSEASGAAVVAAGKDRVFRLRCNATRPHQALGWLTPTAYRVEKLGLATSVAA